MLGNQIRVLTHWNHIANIAILGPNALFTQPNTPSSPFLMYVEDISADTSATGAKNNAMAKKKKKNIYVPDSAVEGRLRILSIEPVINRTSSNNPILLLDDSAIFMLVIYN